MLFNGHHTRARSYRIQRHALRGDFHILGVARVTSLRLILDQTLLDQSYEFLEVARRISEYPFRQHLAVSHLIVCDTGLG